MVGLICLRAEEVELLLELEGAHKKEPSSHMYGVVRATLKTNDGRDQICISDAVWDPDHVERLGGAQAQVSGHRFLRADKQRLAHNRLKQCCAMHGN